MKDFAHFDSATRLCTFRNDLLCCRRGAKKFSNFNTFFMFQKHFPLYHNVPVGHKKILFLFQHIAAGGHQGISIFNVEYFLCDISYTDILYLSQESIKALQFSMLNIFCRRASIYCIPIYYICCRRASRNFNFQC